ncbi:MAG: response regulator [Myxococcota bacterium]
MNRSEALKILAVDEDRARAATLAQSVNQAGLMLRYITDRRQTLAGLQRLTPDLLLLHAEVRSALVSDVLALLGSEVAFANQPIVVLCKDVTDAAFLSGLRSGIVKLLQEPFEPSMHIPELFALAAELPSRSGTVLGRGDSKQLALLIEHVRRTRRSGEVVLDARTAREGKAAFVKGQLKSASFQGLLGVEALIAMVAQPSAIWSFSEVCGAGGDGTGVVIELGEEEARSNEVIVPIEEVNDEEASDFALDPGAKPLPSASAPVSKAPAAEKTRLLLVDDDPTLCQMFARLFAKHGFAIQIEQDGVKGFAAARKGGFDAVIADLNMPHLDGWGMLRRLREDFLTRELPVAFLSCHDDYREALKAQNAGAQAYFSKGTRLETLVDQVRELVRPRLSARANLAQRGTTEVKLLVGAVGPQWLLTEIEAHRLSGRLEAKDSWARYQLVFTQGAMGQATAQAGGYTAEGERAFNAFVASKGAEGRFLFEAPPSPVAPPRPVGELLSRACALLNENERRLREGLLVGAEHIAVNKELYAVYTQVGPKQQLEAARLMCEEGLAPREVISRIDGSPVEIEETLRDLLRRGVVTLAA